MWTRNPARFASLLLLASILAACSGRPTLSPIPPDGVVLAFGDSLTYGTGVAEAYAYPAVLAEMTGWRVVRSGVPGEISKAGLARLPEELARVDPDLVIICHGGNDVLRRMNLAVTERNLRDMIRISREHGAEVVVIAVPQFGLFPRPPDFYDRIAEETGVPVEFDVLADLLADNTKKSDQVHFNQAGYHEMARAVADLLAKAGALQR